MSNRFLSTLLFRYYCGRSKMKCKQKKKRLFHSHFIVAVS